MELKQHIRVIKKSRYFMVIFSILVMAAAVLFSYSKQTTYTSSISFAVNRINKQATQYYDDSYYGIQAADLFSQTVISWLITPSVLIEIYDQAGIDPKITTVERFTSRFKTKKYSAQNIVAKFTERDQETAQKISTAIVAVMEGKAANLNRSSDNKALFEIVGTKPVIVKNKINIYLVGVIGLIVGFLFSIVLVYLKEYLRDNDNKEESISHNS